MGILGDLVKNPSFLLIAGVGVALLVFRDKISNFLQGAIGGAETVSNLGQTGNILSENLLGNLTGLQDIAKGITDFKFPEITLPSFEFPKIELPSFVFPDLSNLFPPIPSTDFTETAQNIARADRSRDVFTTQPIAENFNVQTDIEGNVFGGGGVSFIGGTVRETPITAQSTLGFIIDRLGVSASRAASIRAELRGFTPEEESFLGIGSNPPATSGGFQGLTPQEIALRLTGGIISNF